MEQELMTGLLGNSTVGEGRVCMDPLTCYFVLARGRMMKKESQ